MLRPSTVLRLAPLVAAAASAALLATAASAAPAGPSASAPTTQERAAYHAFLHAKPALPARPEPGLVGPRASTLPRYDPAVLSTTLTGPTLVFGQSAFINQTDLAQTIVVKNLGTGSIAALMPISTSICPYEARMSPDGTKVAYLDYGPNCDDAGVLTVLTIAGGATSAIVTPPSNGFLQLPNWSPDSAKILYTQETDDSSFMPLSDELFTVPPSGGPPTPIVGGGLSAYDGVYSPDGNKIAFAQYATSDATNLAVMDASGANVVDLSSTSQPTYSPSRPAWSPDGAMLTYTYYKNKVGNTYTDGIGIAHVDDSNAGGLGVTGATTSDSFFSAWSADGTEIFYDAQTLSANGDPATNDTVFATDVVGHRRATLATDPVHAYTSPSYVGPGLGTGSASSYTPVTPVRLLARTSFGPGHVQDVQVAGGSSPVPPGATAVTLNLTGVGPTLATYLQAYPKPTDGSVPLVSNLNLSPGQVSAVAVQVAVSADGYVRVRNSVGTVGVIVDVSGYFSPGKTANLYSPSIPDRGDVTIGEGDSLDFDAGTVGRWITGLTPVAIVFNLTGAHPTKATYLTAYPTPDPTDHTPAPVVSNLNLKAGETRANLVTVSLGYNGMVRILNAKGVVRTLVDIVGFYGTGAAGGLAYYPLTPTRFLDTRNGTDTHFGQTTPVPAATSWSLQLRGSATTATGMITVPNTAQAYVYNLTAVAPSAVTYLTAFPFAAGLPTASTVNAPAHGVVPNLAITGADAGGLIGIYNRAGSTAVLLDVAGYYAP